MTTLREFILSHSLLPTGNSIRQHLNKPTSGETVVVNGVYTVTYLGESPETIIYENPKLIRVVYVGQEFPAVSFLSRKAVSIRYLPPTKKINIKYTPTRKVISIVYVPSPKITLEISCLP